MSENDLTKTINKIHHRVKTSELVESDILEFFTLFETDDLLDYTNTGDWWCGGMLTFKSQDLKLEFFIPFMEQVLGNQQLRDVFIEECHRRIIIKDDSFAEAKIIEIFLYEVSLEKLRSFCYGIKEQFFNLFYQLIKKIVNQRNYSSDFWPYGFVENIDEILSPIVKKKVSDSIIDEEFDVILFLSNEGFLQILTLIDFTHLILDPKLDFINFIIKKTSESNDKYGLYECGITFPRESERISQFISKKLMNILNELNNQKTDALLGLGLHRFIHFRDFIALNHDVKKHFYVTAHKHDCYYHEGVRKNLDWQLGQLKYLESGYILQYIAEVIKKGVIEEMRDLFRKRWFSLLDTEDFLSLWDDPKINLYEVTLIINKDLDSTYYEYGIYLQQDELNSLNRKISEKIMETVKKGDEKEIKILFLLDFFDFLNKEEISIMMEDLSFVDLICKLKRNSWDSQEADKIHEFFREYKPLISSSLKSIIIKKLENRNLEEIFKIWDYGYLYELEEEDLINLFTENGVNLIESILKSLHFIAYEQKKYRFDSEIGIIPSDYKEIGGIYKHIDKVDKNLIKEQVVKIIKKQDFKSLVPIVGAYFLNSLEPKDIQELIMDKENGFFKNIIKVLGDYDDELHYYNDDFYIGHLKFFEICKSLNKDVIKYLNFSVINDSLIANYESIIEEGLFEKFSYSELIQILDNLNIERLEVFLISLTEAFIYFEEVVSQESCDSQVYFRNLGKSLTKSLKKRIIKIFKNSKFSPIYFSSVAENFLINIWDYR